MENLVEEAKEKDYEEIINEIQKDLYKIAISRLNNEDDAKDAVQETLMKFYEYRHRINNPQYAKTWIVKVLINECNNIYISKKRKLNLMEKLQSNIELKISDIDKVEERVAREKIFKRLNEKEKEILNLYYENEYTTALIGKLLDMKENTVKSHIHRAKGKLSRYMPFVIIFAILCSSMTFAGRMIRTLKELVIMFQITSTKAIDDAILENFAQSVNTDFSYDNGIGIKIDNVAIDDKFLYISYLFDIEKELSDINLENYHIYDNSNNVLSATLESSLKNIYGSDYSSEGITYDTKPVQREDGTWSYSTVFQVVYDKNYPLSKTINIEIDEISVLSDNKREIIEGNWKLNVDLEDRFAKRDAVYYTYSSDEKIKNISAKLNDMSFELVIDFNEDINEFVVKTNNLFLQDENGEMITCFLKNINEHKNRVTYICDIGKYSKNIDKLNLYLKYAYESGKYIDVVLEK